MPVTTRPSPELVGKNKDPTITLADADTTLFEETSERTQDPYAKDKRRPKDSTRQVIRSPFAKCQSHTAVVPYGNGFVTGLIRAFNQDLHLVIRPDDVWLSILTQFNFYVNKHAEELRYLFVEHKGQKTLHIEKERPFEEQDIWELVQEFASLIRDNVVDETLKTWMTPTFSTSTHTDKAIASMVMMGGFQKYYTYPSIWGCGFPSVTLLGERSDWEEIQNRVDKLADYGEEPAEWAGLLKPILRHTILTFDEPESAAVKNFWLRVAYEAGREGTTLADGLVTLSGWITAFAFWTAKGRKIYHYTDEDLDDWGQEDRKTLVLDGVEFPRIWARSMPWGVIAVPMLFRDCDSGLDRYLTVIAGSMGMSLSEDGGTVAPLSGWRMAQDFVLPIQGTTAEAMQAASGMADENEKSKHAKEMFPDDTPDYIMQVLSLLEFA